ncbi:ATP-binding protein [Shewanella submarina]|uniref:ATP-binding protein n=1 Tax=Shewanella submarina TaxID=2016376 RepID=A0ABV7G7L8_9GAMM|nr:ATP-binding protein [Shewanella submarina]MCL1038368.1 ATP-binding protein [Shewanella submarina]
MAIVTLIMGDSGAGKSTSLRNLDPLKSLLIQPEAKSLPFKSKPWRTKFTKASPQGSVYVSDRYGTVHTVINAAVQSGKKVIIIDDANYYMQNESLRNAEIKGYDKFVSMAKDYLALFDHCRKLPDDVRVYVMTHTQTDDQGSVRPKTVGKMIDSQIVLEGLFTIVLRAMVRDDRHYFSTKTTGSDCVKTPIGLFDQPEIDNCLAVVDAAICDYEEINDAV